MSWTGTITAAGASMLSQLSGGEHTLTIAKATAGSGSRDAADLPAATALVTEVATIEIANKDETSSGLRIRARVTPVSSAYVCKEIGIWAKIDDGALALFSIHQDSVTGIPIPASSVDPKFIFDLIINYATSYTDDIDVTVDTSAVVTELQLEEVQADIEALENSKADDTGTVLKTTLSRGRKGGTTIGTGSSAFGNNVEASGSYSHAEGSATVASGAYSHAEGQSGKASNHYAHAEGYDSKASGNASHAEGFQSTASGDYSHSEGYGSVASGYYSHVEGYGTEAIGSASHAEGWENKALGHYSHATGKNNIAYGVGSVAEGQHNVILSQYARVFGKYNYYEVANFKGVWEPNTSYVVGDVVIVRGSLSGQAPVLYKCTVANTDAEFDSSHWTTNNLSIQGCVELVGGGSESSRKNLRKLDTDGNEYIKGDVYVECNDDSTGGLIVGAAKTITNDVTITSEDGTIRDVMAIKEGRFAFLKFTIKLNKTIYGLDSQSTPKEVNINVDFTNSADMPVTGSYCGGTQKNFTALVELYPTSQHVNNVKMQFVGTGYMTSGTDIYCTIFYVASGSN